MNSPRMQTLPIPADAANALLPSMGSASTVTGAKTAEFSQVLQQWDSATRPPADGEGNRSQDALTHSPVADAASGEEAALPRNPSTGASQTSAATRGADSMEANLAAIPGSAANQLAINIDNAGMLNSGDDPKPGGTKKADAKQAATNPHIASQRAAKQPSNLTPARSAVSACVAAPSQTAVPLPTFRQAVLEPGASAVRGTSVPLRESIGAALPGMPSVQHAASPADPLATKSAPEAAASASMMHTAVPRSSIGTATVAAIPIAASGASAAAQPQSPTTANVALAAAAATIPEAARDAMREVARKVTGQAFTEAMTTAAASSAISSAQLATASIPKSIVEPVTLPTKARPQAAMAPAHPAPTAQVPGGTEVRSPSSGTQPTSNAAPLSAEKISAKSDSTLSHPSPFAKPTLRPARPRVIRAMTTPPAQPTHLRHGR